MSPEDAEVGTFSVSQLQIYMVLFRYHLTAHCLWFSEGWGSHSHPFVVVANVLSLDRAGGVLINYSPLEALLIHSIGWHHSSQDTVCSINTWHWWKRGRKTPPLAEELLTVIGCWEKGHFSFNGTATAKFPALSWLTLHTTLWQATLIKLKQSLRRMWK